MAGLVFLYIYTIIIAIILARAIKQKKSSTYIFMWTCYFVSAVFCVLCKTFQDTLVGHGRLHDEWYNLSDTTLYGYLLIILCNLISFKPFENYTSNKFIEKYGNRKGDNIILLSFSYLFVIFFMVYIFTSLNVIKSAFSVTDFGALRNKLYGNELHQSTAIISPNFIGETCFKICWTFRLLAVFVSFILLQKGKRRLGLLTLFCDFWLVFIYSNVNAARGGLLIFLFCSFLFSIPVLKKMPKKVKKILFILVCCLAIVVVSFVVEVTLSRTADNTSGGNMLLKNASFYLGHGPIIFSKLTGSLKEFGLGKVVFLRIASHFFGFTYDVSSVMSEIGYPAPLTNLFYTYLGPIYMDFGSIGCILFFSLWSFFVNRLMKERRIRLSTVYVFSYYMYFFVLGTFVVGALEFASLVTNTCVAILLRLIENTVYNRYN